MANNESTSCPVCGSTSVSHAGEIRREHAPYGPEIQYTATSFRCNTCGEFGDFLNTNDQLAEQAMADSISQSVSLALKSLSDQGLSNAYIERALELPSRTISRWKAGEQTAATIALLRIVRTFPWVLRVAENKYHASVVNRELLVAAGQVLADFVSPLMSRANVECRVELKIHSSGTMDVDGHAPLPARDVTTIELGGATS